jgi:predicted HNH restriction endonuclease
MNFAVITENDESKWKDKTGEEYHLPKRYLSILTPGTKVIYYKGKIRNNDYLKRRLSPEPHYFGCAIIGNSHLDPESEKDDHYVEITDYNPFSYPVIAKHNGLYLEPIPKSRETNYWRDGVRQIDQETYQLILTKSSLSPETMNPGTNDLNQGLEASLESRIEGQRVSVSGTRFERDPRLRQQAVLIHGYSCQACEFNFEQAYGSHGQGFIHVHHLKPLHTGEGSTLVNPATDLAVLCANCHAMVHRYKNKTLSIGELKSLIRSSNTSRGI